MYRIRILFVATALFAALFVQSSTAQPQSHAERKVISQIAPFYPDVAKRNHIKGIVRLAVVVRKNGSVQSAEVLGGNPLLSVSATYAVQKWRVETASEETTEIIKIAFDN